MANTVSLLVRQQLPEFIRTDYDTFVTFVESYYEWMDQSGNVIDLSKNIPTYMDLDSSLNDFTTYFIQQFLPLFPEERLNNPTFFIQHAKEFYRSKGTTKAIRLLFRLLFNQNIEVFYPKESILRASDSGWRISPALRLDPTMWTIQQGDGASVRFRALTNSRVVTPAIYFNDVLQVGGYSHSPNEPWITYTSAPASNVQIRTTYRGEDISGLFNTNEIVVKMVGQSSNASAISETLDEIIESTVSQLDLKVSSPKGSFTQFEVVKGRWTYDVDAGSYLDIYGRLISYLAGITLTGGGLSYNVGDPVIISGGNPANTATAIVDSIFTALISNITVIDGGVGYQPGQAAYITSTPNTGLNAFVLSVDTSGNVHPNSYPINQDVISLWANTVMSDPDFYFTPGVSENVNTLMSVAFTDFIVGNHSSERLGPITAMTITTSTQVFNPAPTLNIDAPIIVVAGNTANGNVATANVPLSYFGILGRMNVAHGGIGYVVGDEISFENIPGVGIGIGAAAEVTSIHSANSGIKEVRFRPSRVTGNVNVNILISNTEVVGTGTLFTTQLNANDRIEINSESTYATTIVNNTHLIVNTAFTKSSTQRKLGVYGRYFVGGMNYRQDALPTLHVSSGNPSATGATVLAELVISSGQQLLLQPQTEEPPGKIRSIRITNPGYGYQSTPTINLTGSGDGRATAVAIMLSNIFTSPGRFLTTQGFLSSDQKLQSPGYYTTFAYVIRSETELDKYKTVLKNLIHPAGLNLWGEYLVEVEIAASTSVSANIANTYIEPS